MRLAKAKRRAERLMRDGGMSRSEAQITLALLEPWAIRRLSRKPLHVRLLEFVRKEQ